MDLVTLDQIHLGDKAIIHNVMSDDRIRRRLLDIGLVDGTCVECVLEDTHRSFIAYLIRGAVIAIRVEDLRNIMVEKV